MRVIGMLVAAMFVAVSAGPAFADDPTNKKQADQKFIEGRELLKITKFKEACDKFHEAQKFDEKAVVILLNLGLCYEKQNLNASALRWYRKTQTASSESPDPAAVKDYEDAAKEATARLSKIVSKVTFVVGNLQPEAVKTIDGTLIDVTQLTIEVDAGRHLIEAKLPGHTTSRVELVVKDGTAEKPATFTHQFSALVDVNAPNPQTRRRIIGVVIAVGTMAIVGTATALYSKGQADTFNNEDPKIGGPDGDAPNAKRNMRIAGGIFVGTAVIAVAIGGYLFFTKPKESNETAFVPVVSRDEVGFAFSRRF